MIFDAGSIVVFDLDDTLYPERQFVESGFRAVCDYLLEKTITAVDLFPSMWRLFCEGQRGTVFNTALTAAGTPADDALVERLVEVYRTHMPRISLYSDVPAAVGFCRTHAAGTCMLTDGYLQVQRGKVRALGIEPWFDPIVYTDELGRDRWKPHPAGFEKIMAYSGKPPGDHVYVGDNPGKDFAGPRSLGWKTVHIQRPDGLYCSGVLSTEPACRADTSIACLDQLVAMFQ